MKKIFLSLICAAAAFACGAQSLDKAGLLEDFDFFFNAFEQTHPDPYSAFGGEEAFRSGVSALRLTLARTPDLTADALQTEINRFLIPLHDGHTYCGHSNFSFDGEIRYLPLNLRTMSDSYFVWAAGEDFAGLLGARLEAVGGLSVDELLDRVALFRTAENKYGLMAAIGGYQMNNPVLQMLLDDFNGENVQMRFTTREGNDTTVVMPLVSADVINGGMRTMPTDPRFPSRNFEYKWADRELGVMAFKCSSVVSRDCLQFMKDQGMEEYESTKQWAFGDTPLEDIPCMAERFGAMLLEMKEAGAQHLIIDLRGNGGGWTPILYAALYQLYGDDFLKADLGTVFETKVSELYLRKNNVTLDEFNSSRGTSYRIGDFIRNTDGDPVHDVTDEVRKSIIDSYICLDKDMLLAQDGAPLYRPEHVYVVTNEGTFSAAFHFTYMLWKMGATVVGVPSSQAPDTYMEVTPFTLPNTGIECSASNSIQRFLPADDPRAKVFWPDWIPSWEDYRQVNFDSRADLLYILSRLLSSSPSL